MQHIYPWSVLARTVTTFPEEPNGKLGVKEKRKLVIVRCLPFQLTACVQALFGCASRPECWDALQSFFNIHGALLFAPLPHSGWNTELRVRESWPFKYVFLICNGMEIKVNEILSKKALELSVDVIHRGAVCAPRKM